MYELAASVFDFNCGWLEGVGGGVVVQWSITERLIRDAQCGLIRDAQCGYLDLNKLVLSLLVLF